MKIDNDTTILSVKDAETALLVLSTLAIVARKLDGNPKFAPEARALRNAGILLDGLLERGNQCQCPECVRDRENEADSFSN